MALPAGVTTATLTFGPYTDAEGQVQYEGLVGLITPSSPIRHAASGAVVVQQAMKVIIGQGGVGSVVLPQTDQAGLSPSPFAYTITWQTGRFDGNPGNLTFALPVAAGSTVDFDTLAPAGTAASNPIGVLSVNGKVGTLTLSAADVGADAAGAATAAVAGLAAVARTGAYADLSGKPVVAVVATVSASGALASNAHTPVDATSGARTMTLPTGAAGDVVSVEKSDASTNAVTVTGSLRGGASSISLVWQNESIVLRRDAAGSWWPYAGHKTKVGLDAAYAGQVTDAAVAAQVTSGATTTAALKAAYVPGRVLDANGNPVTTKRVSVVLDANGDLDDIIIEAAS